MYNIYVYVYVCALKVAVTDFHYIWNTLLFAIASKNSYNIFSHLVGGGGNRSKIRFFGPQELLKVKIPLL